MRRNPVRGTYTYLYNILIRCLAAVALEESNLENLRLIQHKDMDGNIISKLSQMDMHSTIKR
jgi:hypothetical protein